MTRALTADVCVVGAGSGGFGAACAAARLGASVIVLEAAAGVGGTSTWAGVNNWEPVAGDTGRMLQTQLETLAGMGRRDHGHPR